MNIPFQNVLDIPIFPSNKNTFISTAGYPV